MLLSVFFVFTPWRNAGENIVDNVVTTFCHHCINVVLQPCASGQNYTGTTLYAIHGPL